MKEIEMLSALRPASPVWSFALSRKSAFAPPATLFFLMTFFLLTALNSPTAFAQGSFTTNKSFTVSLDSARHFTLKSIPVVYKPLNGSAVSGFLTLSGTPDNRSLTLFSSVHLAFTQVLGGEPTVTDTFSHGMVTPVSTNLYCIASLGKSRGGNSFNLYGGFLSAASSGASFSGPRDVPAVTIAKSAATKSASIKSAAARSAFFSLRD